MTWFLLNKTLEIKNMIDVEVSNVVPRRSTRTSMMDFLVLERNASQIRGHRDHENQGCVFCFFSTDLILQMSSRKIERAFAQQLIMVSFHGR